MAWFKRSSRFTILAVALTLGLAANVPVSVQAQDTFRPPRTSTGSPDNTQPGGTRTGGEECMADNSSPAPLVPTSQIGATAAEYPTVYWYMPKSRAYGVEFVLRDANEQKVYSVKYSLDKYAEKAQGGTDDYFVVGAPGIMSLTVPASAGLSPLEIGQEYQWELKVVCSDPSQVDGSQDITINGKLKRVQADANLAIRAQQASPEERVALYQNAQLWYEAVGTIVELQRQRPTDRNLAATWDKLLNSVGL
jgi:hypothetical protein